MFEGIDSLLWGEAVLCMVGCLVNIPAEATPRGCDNLMCLRTLPSVPSGQNHPWEYREMGDAENKQTNKNKTNKKQGPLMTLTPTKAAKEEVLRVSSLAG